jgi:hypothetical protein
VRSAVKFHRYLSPFWISLCRWLKKRCVVYDRILTSVNECLIVLLNTFCISLIIYWVYIGLSFNNFNVIGGHGIKSIFISLSLTGRIMVWPLAGGRACGCLGGRRLIF